jgi:putative glutamine amidotransferase
MRPVAGIICCTRTVGIEPAQAVMNRYVASAMRYADAAALLVPSMPELMKASEVAARLDGLMLTGSPSNLDPALYGQDVPDAPGPFDAARDTMTADLIKAMLDLGRPVFGVCRGFQEINVAFGGTLRRDMATSRRGPPPPRPRRGRLQRHVRPRAPRRPDPRRRAGPGLRRPSRDRQFRALPGRRPAGRRPRRRGPRARRRGRGGVGDVNGAPVLAVQWHPEWKTERNPQSQAFFQVFGRALRGEGLRPPA